MDRKRWSEMGDDDRRAKVAELSGWERGPKEDSWIGKANTKWHRVEKEQGFGWQNSPPDFLNDLNAMHEAERVLVGDMDRQLKFIEVLDDVIGGSPCEPGQERFAFAEIHATAAQRAEAFALTMDMDDRLFVCDHKDDPDCPSPHCPHLVPHRHTDECERGGACSVGNVDSVVMMTKCVAV